MVTEERENDLDATAAPECIEPNSSLYFLYRVRLACIGRNAMEEIHSPRTAWLMWDVVETSVTRNNAGTMQQLMTGWLNYHHTTDLTSHHLDSRLFVSALASHFDSTLLSSSSSNRACVV
jgi:hypothetical protein